MSILGVTAGGGPGAEALLVVDVVEALALAVVRPDLDRHQLEVVELVLVAQAGADVVGEEARRRRRGRWTPGPAGPGRRRARSTAGCSTRSARTGCTAASPGRRGGRTRPWLPSLAEAHVDPGVPEPEPAPAGGAAGDVGVPPPAGTAVEVQVVATLGEVPAALEGGLDVDDDVLRDVAPGLDPGAAGEEVALRPRRSPRSPRCRSSRTAPAGARSA